MRESEIRAQAYFRELGSILRPKGDPIVNRDLRLTVPTTGFNREENAAFVAAERKTPEYQAAKEVFVAGVTSRREARLQAQKERALLTQEQETIKWAQQIAEEYAELPQDKSHRKKRKEFVVRNATGLWQKPEKLEVVLGVWKSQNEDLYNQTTERLRSEVSMNWHDITSEQLAQFVTEYTRGESSSEVFGELLKSYFQGTKTEDERATAFYTYATGVLDLVDNPIALKEGVKVGVFETDILPRGGDFHQGVYLVQRNGRYNETLQRQAARGELVLNFLIDFVGLDEEEVRNNNAEALTTINPSRIAKIKARSYKEAAVNRKKKPKITEKDTAALNYAIESGTTYDDPLMDDILEATNFYDDPILEKFYETTGGKLSTHFRKNRVKEQLKQEGITAAFVSIPVPGKPYVLEVAIPTSLIEEKSDIVRKLIQEDAEVLASIKQQQLPIWCEERDMRHPNGLEISAWFRPRDKSEGQQHPLALLNETGFPQVASENLQEENAALAAKIRQTQIRFLSKRGYTVPLTHPDLRALGYQDITFRKDASDPRKIKTTITVSGVQVDVKLDKYLNFDFEGKPANLDLIGDSLRNVLLSLLYPVLCEEQVRGEKGESIDIQKLFVSRVGHLRFLHKGNFSETQSQLLLEHEGLSLAVVSEERKKAGETRNTTYVKPTEADEDQPPVVVRLSLSGKKFLYDE